MLCYILAQYALFIYKNILLFFRHKKNNPTSIVVGFLISNFGNRHLQIQFQQVADASKPWPGICKSNSSKFADDSDPDQASVAPKTTNQRCPPVNFLLKFAGGHLYCISISSNSYICLFLIHRGLSRPVSWHLSGHSLFFIDFHMLFYGNLFPRGHCFFFQFLTAFALDDQHTFSERFFFLIMRDQIINCGMEAVSCFLVSSLQSVILRFPRVSLRSRSVLTSLCGASYK